MNLGGVQTGTITVVDCPRCGKKVGVRAGLVLRIPNREVYWCHEVIDPHTGTVVRKGSD